MGMAVLMGVGNTVVSVLMGMGMLVVMGMTAGNMIVMNVHNVYSFYGIFSLLYPDCAPVSTKNRRLIVCVIVLLLYLRL